MPLAAAPAAVHFALVGGVEHDYDEVVDDDDGGGRGCFDVRSAITTPVLDELDGRWDENGLTCRHISCFSYTQERG